MAWILESSVEHVNDDNRFWGCCCVFCAGFTEERTIERASSCYWTEPPLPEAFHRVSRAAGHLERQVTCPQIFPVGPGPRETAEQHYPETKEEREPGQRGHSWRRAVLQRSQQIPGNAEWRSSTVSQVKLDHWSCDLCFSGKSWICTSGGSFWIWISFNIKTSWELFVRFLGCPVKSTVLQSTLNSIFNPV